MDRNEVVALDEALKVLISETEIQGQVSQSLQDVYAMAYQSGRHSGLIAARLMVQRLLIDNRE